MGFMRRLHFVHRWIVSILFAALALFCLLVGAWAPLLFIIAPVCIVCCAVVNPWVARRYERWRCR